LNKNESLAGAASVYGSLWNDSDDSWQGPRQSLALFATSSADETSSLDLDWNQASWGSQYDAFSAVWGQLKDVGLTPVLRVHPNLLNKNPRSTRREIQEIKKFRRLNPDFLIVWPASPVSTYRLISYSKVVVVDNSTVGLEASLEEIPVICTNSTSYDLIADITRVHGPQDLGKIKKMSDKSDPLGALRFIAAQEILDEHVPPNEFGIVISDSSRLRLLIPSILDGSIASILLSYRWRLLRLINLALTPKT
jgi:hypothetical protein